MNHHKDVNNEWTVFIFFYLFIYLLLFNSLRMYNIVGFCFCFVFIFCFVLFCFVLFCFFVLFFIFHLEAVTLSMNSNRKMKRDKNSKNDGQVGENGLWQEPNIEDKHENLTYQVLPPVVIPPVQAELISMHPITLGQI